VTLAAARAPGGGVAFIRILPDARFAVKTRSIFALSAVAPAVWLGSLVLAAPRPGWAQVAPAAPAVKAAPAQTADAGAGPPQVAFPGQYAPPVADRLHPTNPKQCRALTVPADRMACFEHVAFTWPGLERFAVANASLAPVRPGERRVVFMGDSITDNWSRAGYGGFFPGKPYINRGIGGQTAGQMLVRFQADVVALQPRAVVILAGTNDIAGNGGPVRPETIQAHIAAMAQLARASGIKVVLASVLPVSDDKLDGAGKVRVRSVDRPREAVLALNRWIAEYARRNRHVLLDYHAATVDARGALRPELNDDGLHPNAAGYAVMAPLAEKAIAAALGR
jgi:lysophospholipase L1-like esterase